MAGTSRCDVPAGAVFPLASGSGRLSGGGRECAGQRTAQRAFPTKNRVKMRPSKCHEDSARPFLPQTAQRTVAVAHKVCADAHRVCAVAHKVCAVAHKVCADIQHPVARAQRDVLGRLTRKPELKPQLARMTLIENDLETNIASKSEAGAINETRLTSVKSAKSAVLISEFGFNPSVNL